jgi:hypothetical protein
MTTSAPDIPAIGAVAPWFGSNRMLASEVGKRLDGCSWVGVPFAGGMCELPYITARTLMINDVHRHVINLARVMADPQLGPRLYRRLRRRLFHPDELVRAQAMCLVVEAEIGTKEGSGLFTDEEHDRLLNRYSSGDLNWAEAYFVSAWMPRHGSSGTSGELNAGLSTRWNAGGGDSAKHYWNAVASIQAWRRILRRANFTTLDFRDFLAKCKEMGVAGISIGRELDLVIAAPAKPSRYIPESIKREVYKKPCVICGGNFGIHVDHIKPISLGGSNHPSNLQSLCWLCNNKKSNRLSNTELRRWYLADPDWFKQMEEYRQRTLGISPFDKPPRPRHKEEIGYA